MVFCCCKSVAQSKFQINGHITNSTPSARFSKYYFKNGDTIVLRFINLKRKDTVFVNNNTFKLIGEVPYPSIAMIEHKRGSSLILIDNSIYDFQLTIDTIQRIYDPEIKTLSKFHNKKKDFDKVRTKLYERKNIYSKALAGTKNEDSILYYNTKILEADNDLAISYKKLAADNPNSYLTAYMVPAAPDFSYDGYIAIYNALSDDIKKSFYGKNFYDKLKAAQNIQATNTDEQILSLPIIYAIDTTFKKVTIDKVFFKKQKYTLIEFGASWCIPCKKMNEEFRQKLPALKSKGLTIIGFSLDNTFAAWKKGVEIDNLNWLQISDLKATNSPIAKFLNITAVPTNVLIDSEGVIVKKDIYGDELDAFLISAK